MGYLTERDAWVGVAFECNRQGRKGLHVRSCGVIPPNTATDLYHIWVDTYTPEDATES